MEKKVYYIHPATDHGIVFVTEVRKDWRNRRETILEVAFMIDTPDRWGDDEWNLHIDGCDYQHSTIDSAIRQGADFYDYYPLAPSSDCKPGYELRRVGIPFDWNNENPDYYNIKNAQPYNLQ